MKKLFILLPLVALFILGGCEKIKLNRLKGYWKLKSWTLRDANGASYDGLSFYPGKDGEEIILEFPDDTRALLVVIDADTLKYADLGVWIQEDNFETITFTDSVFFFNQDVPYEFTTLSGNKLELEGYFINSTDSFPQSILKFEAVD